MGGYPNASVCGIRERAIGTIVESVEGDAFIVATNGKASRELFERRRALGQDNRRRDFLSRRRRCSRPGCVCSEPSTDQHCSPSRCTWGAGRSRVAGRDAGANMERFMVEVRAFRCKQTKPWRSRDPVSTGRSAGVRHPGAGLRSAGADGIGTRAIPRRYPRPPGGQSAICCTGTSPPIC